MDFLVRSYVMWLFLCFMILVYVLWVPGFWMILGGAIVLVAQNLVRKDD